MPAIVAAAIITAGVGAGTAVYGSRSASRAADKSRKFQIEGANAAAEIEAKAAADVLQFQRDQEAQRRKEHEATEAKNWEIYQEELAFDRAMAADDRSFSREQVGFNREQVEQRYEDLEPYRRFGVGSLAQLGRPIQNIPQYGVPKPKPQAGTLGAMRR